MIKSYWCKSENFGDALTPWLIETISGQPVEYAEPSPDYDTVMVTGSILNWNISHSTVLIPTETLSSVSQKVRPGRLTFYKN